MIVRTLQDYQDEQMRIIHTDLTSSKALVSLWKHIEEIHVFVLPCCYNSMCF